jgi:transcriptional regulator with XRE-family HTH domain
MRSPGPCRDVVLSGICIETPGTPARCVDSPGTGQVPIGTLRRQGKLLVSEAGSMGAMWRDLGRQLAALRREAALTQHALGTVTGFSRSTVSLAEIGRAAQTRQFWQVCDKALATGGVLAAGADQIGAVRDAQQHAAACAAQEAREARALAAFAAARSQRGISAAVSAVQSCPNCGCEVTILTTLIPGNAAARLTTEHTAGVAATFRDKTPARG